MEDADNLMKFIMNGEAKAPAAPQSTNIVKKAVTEETTETPAEVTNNEVAEVKNEENPVAVKEETPASEVKKDPIKVVNKVSTLKTTIVPLKKKSGLKIVKKKKPRVLEDYNLPTKQASVSSYGKMSAEALEELETIMQKQFTSNSAVKSSNVGGVNQAAKIMNFTKSDMETQIMGNLMERDEDLTGRIQDNMFVFDNLSGVDARSIQVLIRNIETDLLMVALKGADDLVKDTFLDNMSKRAGILFLDDMEAKGPMRISEVEEAQKDILRTARRLSDAGEMMLGGGADFV
jgi:hypothetical protein